jgi:hypothetical protein
MWVILGQGGHPSGNGAFIPDPAGKSRNASGQGTPLHRNNANKNREMSRDWNFPIPGEVVLLSVGMV